MRDAFVAAAPTFDACGFRRSQSQVNRQRRKSRYRTCSNPGMIVALLLLAGGVGAACAIAHQLTNAPEAFEDETGFHLLERGEPAGGARLVRLSRIAAAGVTRSRSPVPSLHGKGKPVAVPIS